MEIITISKRHPIQPRQLSQNVYLVPFFNFFFYLGFIPFKTVYSTGQDIYYMRTFFFQKVWCGFCHLGIVAYYVVCLIAEFGDIMECKTNVSESMVAVFSCGGVIASFVVALSILNLVWRGRDDFLKVCESLRCTPPKNLKIIQILGFVALAVFIFINGVLSWFSYKEYTDQNFPEDTFLDENQPMRNFSKWLNDSDPTWSESEDIDMEMDVGSNATTSSFQFEIALLRQGIPVVFVYFGTFFVFCQILFLVLVLGLFQVWTDHERDIEDDSRGMVMSGDVKKGLSSYKSLKGATGLIRKVFGDSLLAYFVASICYYAQAPHITLGRQGETEKLFMIYSVLSGIIWIFAAQFHQKVRNSFLDFIGERSEHMDLSLGDRLKLMATANEVSPLESNVIALSSRCFPVTYSHLGSIIVVVVTYGLIVFQMKLNTNSNVDCT